MKSFLGFPVIFAIVFVCCGLWASETQNKYKEKVPMNPIEFIQNLNEAFVRGDVKTIGEYLDDDVTIFVPADRMRWEGKAQVIEKLKEFFAKARIEYLRGSEFKLQQYGDVAVVTYRYERQVCLADAKQQDLGKETYVLVRKGASWRVVHDHFSKDFN